MPSLRPILLAAVVSLWSAAGVVANADTDCLCTGSQCTLPCPGPPALEMTLPPPATVTPFPFCPPRPPGGSIVPFPWAPPQPRTLYPQDPGFLPSAACHARMAAAWLPMFVVSAFWLLLQ